MKRSPYALILIILAFSFGSVVSHPSRAESPCEFQCGGTSITSTRPFIADAGFISTHVTSVTGSFYASKAGNSISVDENSANLQGASATSAVAMDWSGVGVTAIGSLFENGNATHLTIDDVRQVVTISNMPTSDPHILNALYAIDGVLHISGG